MITFSKIGKKGNLGNQLFQIAATIGLAVKSSSDYAFLPWRYQSYFKNKLPSIAALLPDTKTLIERHYNYHAWTVGDQEAHYDLNGWMQSEKYFDTSLAKFYFQFTEDLIDGIKKKYNHAFARKTILISIRRGDFVNHPHYYQLPIAYYMNALARYFPDWQSRNLIVLSDDLNYCKFHFSFLENAYFGDNLSAIEQLCLGSLCDDFIISNSTFSWWSAWLGEKSNSIIIRPPKNFDGEKRAIDDDKDYFPERWQSYNHRNEKLKLEDISFYLAFKKNNDLIRRYLLHYFEAEISDSFPSVTTSGATYVLKKDYVLPPLLILYSCLKANENNYSSIINNADCIFNLSRPLNYASFMVQHDFGMFSKVFSFIPFLPKKGGKDIFVKSNKMSESQRALLPDSGNLIISVTAGRFCAIGGYKYSIQVYLQRNKIMFKRALKNMLSKEKI